MDTGYFLLTQHSFSARSAWECVHKKLSLFRTGNNAITEPLCQAAAIHFPFSSWSLNEQIIIGTVLQQTQHQILQPFVGIDKATSGTPTHLLYCWSHSTKQHAKHRYYTASHYDRCF